MNKSQILNMVSREINRNQQSSINNREDITNTLAINSKLAKSFSEFLNGEGNILPTKELIRKIYDYCSDSPKRYTISAYSANDVHAYFYADFQIELLRWDEKNNRKRVDYITLDSHKAAYYKPNSLNLALDMHDYKPEELDDGEKFNEKRVIFLQKYLKDAIKEKQDDNNVNNIKTH